MFGFHARFSYSPALFMSRKSLHISFAALACNRTVNMLHQHCQQSTSNQILQHETRCSVHNGGSQLQSRLQCLQKEAKRTKDYEEAISSVNTLLVDRKLRYDDVVSAINIFKMSNQAERCLEVCQYVRDMNGKKNNFYYNSVIATCATTKDSATAIMLLNDMKAQKIQPDQYTYNSVISACVKNRGQLGTVIKLMREMQDAGISPTSQTYHSAISACAKVQGQCKMALNLLREMQSAGHTPNERLYNAVVFACEKDGGQWETGLMLLREKQRATHTPKVRPKNENFKSSNKSQLSHLLKTAVKTKCYENAVNRTNMLLESRTLRSTECMSAINIFRLSKQPQKCLEVLQYLREINGTLHFKHYDSAIHSLAIKYPATSVMLLEEMKALDIRPGEHIYNRLIRGCGNGKGEKQWNTVIKLFWEMKGAGFSPSSRTYAIMILACAKVGQWETALRIKREMQSRGLVPNIITFNTTISACAHQGQWQIGREMLREMRDSGLSPDIISYSSVISACAKSGTWQVAVSLLREMLASGTEPDTIIYSAVISACEKGKAQWETALALLREMQTMGLVPDTIIYNSTISACANGGGRLETGLMLLQEMQNLGLTPNTITYSALISARGEGDWKTAIELLRKIQSVGLKPDTIVYSNVISACAEAGQGQMAITVFDEMGEVGLDRDIIVYGSLIEALGKHGNMNDKIDQMYEVVAVQTKLGEKCWSKLAKYGFLDLHDHSGHMARAAVRRLFNMFREVRGNTLNERVRFRSIVVGAGNNSANGPVLLEIVQTQLRTEMSPSIRSFVDPRNNGHLMLNAPDFTAWLQFNT
eukprot:CFRG5296T1